MAILYKKYFDYCRNVKKIKVFRQKNKVIQVKGL